MVASLVILGAMAPIPALAQEGPEGDLQRCIWRCLSGRSASDPAYTACVEQQCVEADAPQAPRVGPALPQAQAFGAHWSFAAHPLLGPSLSLQLPDGIIGFACPNPGMPNMEMRLSNGVFSDPSVTVLVDTDHGTVASSLDAKAGQPWSAREGSACTALVGGLDRATQVTLVPCRIHAITQTDHGTRITIVQAGFGYSVLSAAQGLGIPGARALPVCGLATGFSALMAVCPAARADLADFCGL
jgi:hypothetical protein